MTSNADILQSARDMIEEHGRNAVVKCKERADSLYDRGDDKGSTLWRRIAIAVEDLQRPEPEFGDDTQ